MLNNLIELSFFNIAFYICLNKWNVINFYQEKKEKWMPAWCAFCFFFWCGMVEGCYTTPECFYHFFKIFFHSMCIAAICTCIRTIFPIDEKH